MKTATEWTTGELLVLGVDLPGIPGQPPITVVTDCTDDDDNTISLITADPDDPECDETEAIAIYLNREQSARLVELLQAFLRGETRNV